MAVYVTSDFHFCHNKNFLFEPRGYRDIQEHDLSIMLNFRNLTMEDDLYVLGDIMLNNNEEGLKCLKNIPCKIHIIRGNHDTDTRIKLYGECWNVVEVCDAKFLKIGKQNFFLSHYPCLCGNHDDDKPLHKRVINLCGHSHTTDRWADWDKGIIYHCELDAHDNKPVLVDDIITEIKKKLWD